MKYKTLRFTLVSLLMMVCGTVFAGWQKTETLTVGDVVIMAGETQSATKELTAVTTSGTTIGTATDYTGTPAGTYPLTIVAGSTEGSIAFKTTADTYLSWSSGNSLTTAESVADASSWTVAYSNGFTVTNVGTTARILQYNAGSPRFACYGNSGQTKLTFWKQVEDSSVATPTFTPNGGTFVGTTSVEIACETEGATIYYTLNGTDPTAESTEYTAPFTVTETTTVKAIAVKDKQSSSVASATYTKLSIITLAEAQAVDAGTTVAVEGVVVASAANGAVLSDGTDYLYYYNTSNALTVGQKVRMMGELAVYGGAKQMPASATITDLGTQEVTHPTAVTLLGADFEDIYTAKVAERQYVTFTGKLAINDNYYNITIDGTENAIGSIVKPNEDLSELDGKDIVVKGYLMYVNKKYVYIVATNVEEKIEYYVVGSMNEWTVSDTYKLALNEAAEGVVEYMITLDLEANAELKVVKGNKDVWYPEGMDNNFQISDAGKYTIFFRPNADGGEKWHYNVLYAAKDASGDMATALEAAKALVDDDAVAVGKLKAAIEVAEAIENPTAEQVAALQAAIDQFKADNADQVKDETAKVATNGWKNFNGGNAGVCATQFAPAITTYDGRNAQLAEVYEEGTAEGTAVNRIGTIIYQDITGLTNGKYKVGFYGNAFFTPGRAGMTSDMEDGATDVAYVFANDQKEFITARIATSTTENNFRQFDVEVTDGTIKLGMGKEKPGTNWHTMQIYQLTWFTTAKEVYAADQTELKALITEAKALLADESKTNDREMFEMLVNAAEEYVDSKMINTTELESVIGNLKTAIADFKKANWFIDLAAGEYYIIDAESGKMMAAGHDWGTRGIVNEMGLDLTLTPYTESRTVTIDSRVYNKNDHFLGSNLYMDSSEWGWALEYQGFGFYILEPDGGKYINIDDNDNLVLSDTPREWIIVTKDGVMEQRLNEMSEATAENPVDATFLIQGANFSRGDARNNAWTVSDDCNNKNLSGGAQTNMCAESYHSTFTIMQTIDGAPAGLYKMTAQGFYRNDEGEVAAPQFFANGVNKDVPLRTGSENSMSDASASFTAGNYTIEPIDFVVTKEGDDAGKIYVGIKNQNNTQWVIWDNFRLTYYGPAPATTYTVTVAETQNGQVEVDKTEAAEGETVSVTVTPAEGYMVDEAYWTYGEGENETKTQIGEPAEGNTATFTMPAANVTVTVTFKAVVAELEKFYIMGDGTANAWNTTTEMTYNEEAQAFEYTVESENGAWIAFGDVEFTNWDDFNANHRYAIGNGDVNVTTFGEAMQLLKVNGTLALPAGKFNVSVTKDLLCTITEVVVPTHTWDFTQWSETTITNLKAEAAKVEVEDMGEGKTNLVSDNGALWSDHEKTRKDKEKDYCTTYAASKDNCFWYIGGEAQPTANGEVIAELAGLEFNTSYGTSRSLAIAVNYPTTNLGDYNGPSYLWFGGSNKEVMTIKNVKAGTVIKMGVESHNVTKARGVKLFVDGTELTDPEGAAVAVPTTYTEQTWQVPAGEGVVDVVVKNTDGCHIYFIDAEIGEPVETIETMYIVGELTGGWPTDEDWSNAKAMTQNAENEAVWTLTVEGFEAEAKTYKYKATANAKWGLYELPASDDYTFTFGTDEYPAGKYDLTFTVNTTDNTLTLVATKIGGTEGISTLKNAIENGTVYNMNGQKVNKAQKGLYIINGRKVVIK